MASRPPPPNIVLVMSDEHQAFFSGFMGCPFARTPHLDRLAADGVVFENAYCNYALCVPSRNSFMTGRLPYRIGAYDNGSPYDPGISTWAHRLGAAGFDTPLIGKMHFAGPDQKHGFSEHLLEGAHGISGFQWGRTTPAPDAYKTFSRYAIGPEAGAGDRRRRDAALDYLERARPGAPFCLTVGFDFPHYPHACTPEAFARFENAVIPDPLPPGRLSERNRRWREDVWRFQHIGAAETRTLRRIYLAMIAMLDDWVGELRSALEAKGLAENTLFIYTSDHGEMAGERGMWGKNLFCEESSRVPLIVAGPGLAPGRRIATPVSLVDLYPTLCDAAGVRGLPAELDGRSLWPACREGTPLEDEPVFCEYEASEVTGPERMIRLGRYKLNRYDDGEIELFDLAADPREGDNLAGRPALANVERELLARLLAQWDPETVAAQVRASQNGRVLIARG